MFNWNDLKNEIIEDYDLQEQGWINEVTLRRFANSAIAEVELEIQLRKDRYFKRSTILNLVSGQAEYSLPADCFEGKITGLFCLLPNKYKLAKIKHDEEIIDVNPSDDFKYDLYKTVTGYKFNLYPTPQQDFVRPLPISFEMLESPENKLILAPRMLKSQLRRYCYHLLELLLESRWHHLVP